jgi:hypothetical protein
METTESATSVDRIVICERDTHSPACPDCGAVDCDRASGSRYECSSGFLPGGRRVCERCGRMNCQTVNSR